MIIRLAFSLLVTALHNYMHLLAYICVGELFNSGYYFQDDTCMGGLVLVLSNPDKDIVKNALEVSNLF